MSNEKQTVDGGLGPRFEVEDFPEPLRNLTPRKLFAILGPAIIALGGTIGGGEWLIGPSMFVKYGLALLWITTISSLLQVFLNLEMCRYTLYTGEPITVGFMRLSRERPSGAGSSPSSDSASAVCPDGPWVLRRPSPPFSWA